MVTTLRSIFTSPPNPARRIWLLGLVLGLALCGGRPPDAAAQAPLWFVNNETTVEEISFRFVDHSTFETDRLREQIATGAPGTFTRFRNLLSFLPGLRARRFPFDPVTLQKDVVRLRQFYQQNGFPSPDVDYPATQLDTTKNKIHVIFTIREGPFLTIRNTDVRTADGSAAAETLLEDRLQDDWTRFQNEELNLAGRYTDFRRTRLTDEISTWLHDRGYAFASVQSEAKVDSLANVVDLRFRVDAGPIATVSDIQLEGMQSVSPSIVLRELPFRVGDRFSVSDVTQGQQRLFDLGLFRVALADVPEQPRDSTVVVRYRVREAKLRAFSGQGGYGTQSGLSLEGSWRHRNFYGGARSFIVGLTADTGLPEEAPSFLPNVLTRSSSQEISRRFRASVTLSQPYLLTDRLSGSIAPFVQERLNPALAPNPDRALDLNERQVGVTSTLVYDFLPSRTLSLQHSFARTRQFLTAAQENQIPDDPSLEIGDDLFNRSIITLNGTFGQADDYINPADGFLVRPTLQLGGYPFESGVEFVQVSGDISGYWPVSEHLELAGRLFAGRMWPFQESRRNLTLSPSPTDQELQLNRIYQNRFSDYLYHAGGGSDVRGWVSRHAGGKVLRKSPSLSNQYVYRPIGGRSKIGFNVEARFPAPGLGSSWRTAAFVDGAYLTPGPLNLTPSSRVPGIISGRDGSPVSTDPSRLLVGTGTGLRYQTSFGFLRIDVAYKLTPDALDLRSANRVGNALDVEDPPPLSDVSSQFIRRFRLHFGIGRSF